jgi:hypothetical protein
MPATDAHDAGDELADGHTPRNDAARVVIRLLGLRNSASAYLRKDLGEQHPRPEAHERRDDEPPAIGRLEAKHHPAGRFDGEMKEHGREPCEHADHDREQDE